MKSSLGSKYKYIPLSSVGFIHTYAREYENIFNHSAGDIFIDGYEIKGENLKFLLNNILKSNIKKLFITFTNIGKQGSKTIVKIINKSKIDKLHLFRVNFDILDDLNLFFVNLNKHKLKILKFESITIDHFYNKTINEGIKIFKILANYIQNSKLIEFSSIENRFSKRAVYILLNSKLSNGKIKKLKTITYLSFNYLLQKIDDKLMQKIVDTFLSK